MKKCPKCQTLKEDFLFSKSSRNIDGLADYCRECDRARSLKVKRVCRQCLVEFLTSKAHIARGDGQFCSKSCASKFNAQDRIPDPEMNEIAKEARYRVSRYLYHHPEAKGTVCSCCGSIDMIVAHHKNHEFWNAVTWLCRSCHRALHNGGLVEGVEVLLC